MGGTLRIALIGDYNVHAIAHQAIPESLRLAGEALGVEIEGAWTHTASLTDAPAMLEPFAGVWCVPASPYANMTGALEAIRFAREMGRPFLGTCGGFQHAVLEYARNVCGIADADHAETNPTAAQPLISPLSCSLVETSGEIQLGEEGILRRAYGRSRIVETYHCSYGLNEDFGSLLFRDGLFATAHDLSGQVRAVELTSHPFFAATLFQPERKALTGEIPPLVSAFLEASRRT
jgi:CTP synthase (UTP-ammonia lyase)